MFLRILNISKYFFKKGSGSKINSFRLRGKDHKNLIVKKGILDILKGKFLVSGDAPKNWLFIIFVSFLAAVMIGSSHSADKKVHQIAALNEEVKELNSEFVDVRSDVQKLKLESKITEVLEVKELYPSETPPKKIKVKSRKVE